MNFNAPKPIFQQICDIILDRILSNELQESERILSVRDMAESLSVNPNTVQRSYTELQQKGIIEQQRGIGYFISKGGKKIARQMRKDEFFQIHLPILIHQMKILDISWDELQKMNKN